MDLLFLLLFTHALGDYALQSPTMVEHKHRKNAPKSWGYYLTAHALIHGGLVYMVSGVFWISLAETASHWLIDYAKCEGKIGMHTDQILHIVCKVVWFAAIVAPLYMTATS